MAKNFSNQLKANLIKTSAPESEICLLTIDNPLLGSPIRLVRDNIDIVSNGKTYVSCPFDYSLPNESDQEIPKCQLSIDNIGRGVTRFLEQLQGAPNTSITLDIILRSNPDFIEFSLTLDLMNVSIDRFKITADLQFDRTLNQPAISQIYNKRNMPGAF